MKVTKEEFSEKVEILSNKSKLEIIDATLYVASQHNIEPEGLNKYLSDRLKELIRIEASKRNMIVKDDSATLPI